MNVDPTLVKKVLLFGLGMSLGATVGYFVGGLIVYKLHEKDGCLDESDLIEVENGPEENRPKLNGDEPVVPPEKASKNGSTKRGKGNKVNYAAMSKSDDNDPAAELEILASKYKSSIVSTPTLSELTNPAEPEPYVITELAYLQDDRYKKGEITYYSDDCVYADENDQQIDAPFLLVGPNAHLHFGEQSDDPDIVYIRNERVGMDYEVTQKATSYKIAVLGMEPEPPKKKSTRVVKPKRKVDENEDDGIGED